MKTYNHIIEQSYNNKGEPDGDGTLMDDALFLGSTCMDLGTGMDSDTARQHGNFFKNKIQIWRREIIHIYFYFYILLTFFFLSNG